jgi:hypothetical protein
MQAILLSRQGWGGIGAWWASKTGCEADTAFFPNNHFKQALKYHLLLPLRYPNGATVNYCPYCPSDPGNQHSIEHHPSHAVGCAYVSNYTWRHDQVLDCLASLLSKSNPESIVNKKVLLSRPHGRSLDRHGDSVEIDILVDHPLLGKRYIDVAVVDPGCPKYVDGAKSHTTTLAATTMRADMKIQEFKEKLVLIRKARRQSNHRRRQQREATNDEDEVGEEDDDDMEREVEGVDEDIVEEEDEDEDENIVEDVAEEATPTSPHSIDINKQFIPFIIEANGRLGSAATSFLNELGLSNEVIRRFNRQIIMFLARHAGRSLNALQARC